MSRNPDAILSIKELTRYIKMKLEGDQVLQDVWVRGEISNFTRHSSGHMYFTLKDEASRMKCIMFASHNARLAFMPKEGMKVLARGSLSIYERDGQYQLYLTQMQPDGIGSLFLAFEQLKRRLEEEGLFRAERKKPLPPIPQAIGVITSPTGAAVRDIITTLQRRMPTVQVLLFPVLVQGTQAAASIAKAIEAMNSRAEVDVLIVGRGGGSLEELWAFNEEIVARAIHRSQLPVISAVGHETDFTIADFVADLRAPTPTAAAELAVPHHLELKQQLQQYSQRLKNGLTRQLQAGRERLARVRRSPYLTQPQKQLLQPAERLDRLQEQLVYRMRALTAASRQQRMLLEQRVSAASPAAKLELAYERRGALQRRLLQAISRTHKDYGQRYAMALKQLDALSPLKVMSRGYSLIYDEKQKQLIKSTKQVQLGDIVKIRLADGRLDCHVWSMEENEDEQGNE
ncbi:exodeoxyribonuclease VII large subunit [Paenibacillus sp. y28]|uniref:exodeoxyribonuclease VII large subunit n=1 Tax=Paenibacillus sp. y28 TaxID=3129110 RepID=UPI00301713EE